MDNINKQIRILLIKEEVTIKDLAQMLHDAHDDETTPKPSKSPSNLANKLNRETLKYSEAQKIAELLGYEITWHKKQ